MMIDGFLSGHISLHNQFAEQVFNTNPNYCCNLIYSCISYGCATLNGGVLLTHRLIFSCPHYHTLPSALFLPAYAHTHPPASETERPTSEGQHCSKPVPCSQAQLPKLGMADLRFEAHGPFGDYGPPRHQDIEAQQGCSSLPGSISSRIYQ